MKRTKKLASLLLALVMVFALTIPALAVGETGTITIDNAVEGQTYTVYQILDLESYNAGTGAYSYKATSAWSAFINSNEVKGVYVNVDEQGYVTWIEGASAADFADLAQKYAQEQNIANQGSEKATTTTVTFANLDLGYYLVDSSLGTLCSLDTTNPTVTIKEKNNQPGNVKTVEEDSTGVYGTTNDADIGQVVNFKSTITAQAGAQNYVFHDKMSAGLTFGEVTGVTLNGEPVDPENYTVKSGEELTDGHTFDVAFAQEFCDTLQENDQIVISYNATVNSNAVIGNAGNPNDSKLSYGEDGKTETQPSRTTTYVWEFNVHKYTMKDGEKTPLAGAEFVLYKIEDGKTLYAVLDENNKVTGWTDKKEDATRMTSGPQGNIAFRGLDADTYYLEETKAPDGYNLLKDPVVVVIDHEGQVNPNEAGVGLTANRVEVENKTGSELPSTGGIGTTIFYVVGSILLIGAAVLLITKKRMGAAK